MAEWRKHTHELDSGKGKRVQKTYTKTEKITGHIFIKIELAGHQSKNRL